MAGTILWPLPDVVDPPVRKGICVQVPDDQKHLAAFMGALYGLTRWYNWDRDDAHTGKDVAAVWYDIFTHLTDCSAPSGASDDMQFRQNGCKLEFSIDCVNWQTLYDPTDCVRGLVNQPSPAGAIQPGKCQSWDVTLPGNGRWLLPVPVQEGYTITVAALSGGWYDGGEVAWRCPDGAGYLAGTCAGATTTSSGDPINTAPHMSLIMLIDDGGSNYHTIVGSPFTVPSGVVDGQVQFLANDSDISNNAGSISFHVEVCNTSAPTGWEHIFDFTAANQGFAVRGGYQGQYSAGNGWQTEYLTGGGGQEQFVIYKALSAPGALTEVIAEFDLALLGDVATSCSFWSGGGFTNNIHNMSITATGDNSIDDLASASLSSDITLVLNGYHFASHSVITLKSLTLRGTGSDPF